VKLGLETKRSRVLLGVLGVVIAGAVYENFSDSSYTPAPAHVAAPAPSGAVAGSDDSSTSRSSAFHGRTDQFLPVLHKKHVAGAAEEPQPADPTLRLDLLAKLEKVPAAGSGRDLFNFGKADAAKLAGAEPIIDTWKSIGPPHLTPNLPKVAAGPPAPPPPPPINLKYYGICTTRADGQKTAFFM